MNEILTTNTTRLNLVHNVKLYLASFFNFVGFRKFGNEHEQAVLRLSLVSFIMLYIAALSTVIDPHVAMFWGIYLTFSIGLILHIRIQKKENEKRKILSLVLDIVATSYSVYLLDAIGTLFIGVYLWLIIGNGLRYGNKSLKIAHVISLIGFLTAALLSSFWQAHMMLFYGLFVTLMGIPLHTSRLLSQLQMAIQKAEVANEAKSLFLSHMSHEIRTPLNGIVGACSLLAATPITRDQKKLFDVVHSSSELLVQLVNNVLDIAQIERGKIVSKLASFNLEDLVSSTVSLFGPQVQAKNIFLSYDIANDTPLMLQGELLHIKQVLVNLIGNAVKFTESGSVSVNVKVTKQTENQASILFEIVDTGIGIEESAIKTIFESFTQANNSIKNKFGGTGLGTTISKNLITFMGGNLSVESQLGVGSKFWFELALDKISKNEMEYQVENNLVNAPTSSSEIFVLSDFKKPVKKQLKSFRILVADDNEVNSMIISQILLQHNHQVDVVKNGELALDKLRDTDYDLMILDGNMPVMGGMEVIQIYQALNVGQPQIPTIILSADATLETIESFKKVGISAYLTKPIQIELLAQTIEEAVTQSTFKTAEVLDYSDAKQDSAKLNSQNDTLLLNVSRLDSLKQLDTSSHFIEKLILDFMADTEQRIASLNTYKKARDFIKMKACAHTVAGSAANVGAVELAKLCERLSNIKSSDNFKEIELLVDNVQDIYARSKVFLWDYLNLQSINQQMPK